MYIPIILGTARDGRQSEKAANFMLEMAKDFGLETEIIDVRDYLFGKTNRNWDRPEVKKYAEKIIKADALIIVSPEYNHGYPGELKILLDSLYKEYAGKPVGFCGVSIGPLGGARAMEQLRLVSIEFRMYPIREAMYFSNVAELFDEAGKIKDEKYLERVKIFLTELSRLAEMNRPAGK